MTQAALFNLDDTLLDVARTVDLFLSGHMQRLGVPAPLQQEYTEAFHQFLLFGNGSFRQLFETLQQQFLPHLSLDLLLEDHARHAWQTPVMFPGTYTTLLELRAMGLKLGLITNGTVFQQRAKIAFSRLAEYMDVVLISEAEKLSKPDPQLFQRALERLQVPARVCTFIGEDPTEDIAGAAKVGMKTAWIHHGRLWSRSDVQPDWVLGAVSEAVSVFSRRMPLKI